MTSKILAASLTLTLLLPGSVLAVKNYLSNDVRIDCDANSPSQVREIDLGGDTEHSVFMAAGETLWVGARIVAEHEPSSTIYSKDLVETYLMCGHEVLPSPTLDYSLVQSRSGVNHWTIQGVGSRVVTTHFTKAVYTAEKDGWHSCWVIYACSPKSGEYVTFKKDQSYFTHYSVNAFPGINWIPEGDLLVDSTTKHTPGGSKIWDAGTATQSDTEVVVYWSPRLTNCEAGDAQCGPNFVGYDADTYFDWRIAVYQYQGNTVCQKNFGTWNLNTLCPHDDHHCDRVTYRDLFPIVTGMGSDGDCGGNTAHRRFKVYTQIRKSHESFSDIMVHNSFTGRSNFLIYSR